MATMATQKNTQPDYPVGRFLRYSVLLSSVVNFNDVRFPMGI